ncbi:MAG: hypothetical protein JWP17_767 [Solirubrobacterales bacterium]|nr:hypothetical protein [Solirubrobacterales bacterium]
MPPETASPPPPQLERAWSITESLHVLLTRRGGTDWAAVAQLAQELRAVADAAEPASERKKPPRGGGFS